MFFYSCDNPRVPEYGVILMCVYINIHTERQLGVAAPIKAIRSSQRNAMIGKNGHRHVCRAVIHTDKVNPHLRITFSTQTLTPCLLRSSETRQPYHSRHAGLLVYLARKHMHVCLPLVRSTYLHIRQIGTPSQPSLNNQTSRPVATQQ